MALGLAGAAVCAGLIWTTGAAVSAWAQGGGFVRPEGMVGPVLQYQGRLTSVSTGAPISGSAFMTFRIYDVANGGIPLWSETETVQVTGGLFSTLLGETTPMDAQMFNGQTLWLEVKIESEVTGPRQQILPVAYALGLAPGAVISTTSTAPALLVRNRGAGAAIQVEGDLSVSGDLFGGAHTHDGAAIASGIVAEARIDPLIARDADVTAAVNSATANVRRNYYDVRAGNATAYTITIPHFQLWRLELASDWPYSGGVAAMEGFENDGYTGVTFTKYDGEEGTSGSGGAQCRCNTTATLLVFGSGYDTYGVRCPGICPAYPSVNYTLVITRAPNAVPVNFKLVY
jgi:hypothetical protein